MQLFKLDAKISGSTHHEKYQGADQNESK